MILDQDSDPDATVVEITFGDRLGTLLDTVETYSLLFAHDINMSTIILVSASHLHGTLINSIVYDYHFRWRRLKILD